MNKESNLFLELWDLVRDSIPTGRRYDTALGMFRVFEEAGFEKRDFRYLADESTDTALMKAYADAFDEEDEEDAYDYESMDSDEE